VSRGAYRERSERPLPAKPALTRESEVCARPYRGSEASCGPTGTGQRIAPKVGAGYTDGR
jgi:hypothetical protein